LLQQLCHLFAVAALPVGAGTQQQAVVARLQPGGDLLQPGGRVGKLNTLNRPIGVLRLEDAQFGRGVVAVAKVPPQGSSRLFVQVRTPVGTNIDQVPAVLVHYTRHDLPGLQLVIANGRNPT